MQGDVKHGGVIVERLLGAIAMVNVLVGRTASIRKITQLWPKAQNLLVLGRALEVQPTTSYGTSVFCSQQYCPTLL